MVSVVQSGTIFGVEPIPVRVEAHISVGLPSFQIVGLAEGAVRESRLRVQNALKQSGFQLPKGKISVNLGPAEIPKSGTLLDLPIAIAILLASKQVPQSWCSGTAFVGELAFNGEVRAAGGFWRSLPCMNGRGGTKWCFQPSQPLNAFSWNPNV